MDYQQTLDSLFSLQKFGIKFGLSSTENLLAGLGNPHLDLPCLHLAGSNGKGSVGANVVSILSRAGYRVGFYTSPHLVSFRERFAIGKDLISRDEVIDLTRRVRDVCSQEELPTFFEFVTAMAFVYFAEKKVDLAVLETGMGGRLDATNVARPKVAVITNISVEHTQYLGRTLARIAGEKAGIIKPGQTVVVGEKRKPILEIFEKTAREKGAELRILGRDFKIRSQKETFDYFGPDRTLKHLRPGLLGPHQKTNAALALAAVDALAENGFEVSEEDRRQGLGQVTWPGRGEILPHENGTPRIMLDGAHNPAAAKVLAGLLTEVPYARLHLILGIMADKDIPGVMAPLLPLAQSLFLTRPIYPRAASPEDLARHAAGFSGLARSFPKLDQAIDAARKAAGPDDLILITGSLFTVGEAKEHLQGE